MAIVRLESQKEQTMSTAIQEPLHEANSPEIAGTMQLVSFHLAEETFGVAITKVCGII